MRVCVFVETFGILTYICAGCQLCDNLILLLSKRQPLYIAKTRDNLAENDDRY